MTKQKMTGEFVAEDQNLANLLFGRQNRHLKLIERYLGVRITSKGNRLSLEGDQPQVQLAERLCE
nr:phosphate starvation-inducible protein PhoH [Desulfuromonadales bacterium]